MPVRLKNPASLVKVVAVPVTLPSEYHVALSREYCSDADACVPYVPDVVHEKVMACPPSFVTDFGATAVTVSGCGRVRVKVAVAVRPSEGSVAVAVTVMELPVTDAVSNHAIFVVMFLESAVMVVVSRSTLFAESVRLSFWPARPVLITETASPAIAELGDTSIDRSGF